MDTPPIPKGLQLVVSSVLATGTLVLSLAYLVLPLRVGALVHPFEVLWAVSIFVVYLGVVVLAIQQMSNRVGLLLALPPLVVQWLFINDLVYYRQNAEVFPLLAAFGGPCSRSPSMLRSRSWFYGSW
jgi:hypothetical protein